MRSCISRIANFIDRMFVVALAVALVGSAAAGASEMNPQLRAEAEMNRGADYSAAWATASRAFGQGYSETLVARARKAASALNEGKDYSAAWTDSSSPTDSGYTPDQLARAKRVEEELNEGKDYVGARDGFDATQPLARPEYPAPVKAAGRDGVSAMQ